jgi:integrase
MKRTIRKVRKSKPITWDNAVDQFIGDLVRARRSEHTTDHYRRDLEAFAAWWGRVSETPLVPSAISGFDLDSWSRHLKEERLERGHKRKPAKREPTTINAKMAALTSFLSWAASDRIRIIGRMPEIPPREHVRKSPVAALTAAQQRELLRHASHDKRVPRNQWIIQAMLETGVRLAEFLAFRWGESVEATERTGKWQVLKGKGCRPRGWFPLSPRGLAAFKALKELAPDAGPGDPVCFSQRHEDGDSGRRRPLTVRGVQQMLSRYAEELNWKGGLHAHQLRHSFVLNKRAATSPVDWPVIQGILGHSKVTTTMDHYYRPSKGDYAAAMGVSADD